MEEKVIIFLNQDDDELAFPCLEVKPDIRQIFMNINTFTNQTEHFLVVLLENLQEI